jgi:hypothetical protein
MGGCVVLRAAPALVQWVPCWQLSTLHRPEGLDMRALGRVLNRYLCRNTPTTCRAAGTACLVFGLSACMQQGLRQP